MVDAMFEANDQGAGIAWREGKEVVWKKGLKLGEIQDLIANTPMPFCAHFRIASMGGPIPQLTHPFPVSGDVSLELEGRTKGNVVFHNGHWSEWKKVCFEICTRRDVKPPTGNKWSDSRAISWLTHLYGTGFLSFLDEKVVAFGPGPHTGEVGSSKNLDIFGSVAKIDKSGHTNDHNCWKKINGVWCSNDYFEGRVKKFYNYSNHNSNNGVTPGYHTTAPASLPGVIAKNDDVKVVDGNKSVAEVNRALPPAKVNDAVSEVGGASPSSPFPLGMTNQQMKKYFKSLEEVEEAVKKGWISKKASKRLKKQFQES
jgi:hypothetical protein